MKRLFICAAALLCANAATWAQTVHLNVDSQQNVNSISPYIYGINGDLTGRSSNLTLTRSGGNRLTAYNWENNASNAGSDWYFQNDGSMSSSNTPGAAIAPMLTSAAAKNAAAIVTIPTVGYVAADKNGGGDVRNSGANYLQTRFKVSLPAKGSAFTLTPSTSDGYVYQDEFVNWIKTNYPASVTDPRKPVIFSLDNEPDLWNSTHAEVHPAAATYAEMVQKTTDYAHAIKAVMPNAKVIGPVNYGWQGMVNLQNAPDAAGRDFLNTYLAQMKAVQDADPNHQRLLDVLDVHWYPEAQGDGQRIITNTSTAGLVAARVQAPRSLWDPTYTETSWITQYSTNGPINLLPRLKAKIAANYPGTKLSITEYNYGGGADISGGIAQADVLGIFGREGVYAAAKWQMASDESFISGGFDMYRNFDGNGGSFGDTSVSASTDDVSGTSVYASTDSTNPNRMVLVVINKGGSARTAALHVAFAKAFRDAKIYQLAGSNSYSQYAGVQTINGNDFSYLMPAYSVSTLVLTAVPEPGTLSLLAIGALCVLRRGRRS